MNALVQNPPRLLPFCDELQQLPAVVSWCDHVLYHTCQTFLKVKIDSATSVGFLQSIGDFAQRIRGPHYRTYSEAKVGWEAGKPKLNLKWLVFKAFKQASKKKKWSGDIGEVCKSLIIV